MIEFMQSFYSFLLTGLIMDFYLFVILEKEDLMQLIDFYEVIFFLFSYYLFISMFLFLNVIHTSIFNNFYLFSLLQLIFLPVVLILVEAYSLHLIFLSNLMVSFLKLNLFVIIVIFIKF